MKCCIMWHFICVFAVCQSTHFGITGIQRAGVYIEKALPVSVVISDIFCRGTGTGQSLEHSDKKVIE